MVLSSVSFISAAAKSLHITELENVTAGTAISHRMGGVLWGLVLTLILYWLDNKFREKGV